ncbi:unnamed protein product [Calicophoron daubneyi]|uniref:Dynein light chain n=1 Tax=Calicophoron daubneyi TaxID=300641 RepID=A0AAV2TSI5_CALDB
MEKTEVKTSDMPLDRQSEVVQIAQDAMKKKTVERDIAEEIKSALDTKYGPNWHVIVGKDFGTKVSHEKGNFIFFYVGDKAVQVFKFG